ncbi:hypothetical protein JYU34_006345 [Plutella xylostella]|uniref:Uncharacterized protein n=1 Tax=Plutella xylostella TaxID=51655 RepID=A0ABQ7QRS8_PLUXY|nr:hypothetical protein JYU34_006345 [Plutella xylostella]
MTIATQSRLLWSGIRLYRKETNYYRDNETQVVGDMTEEKAETGAEEWWSQSSRRRRRAGRVDARWRRRANTRLRAQLASCRDRSLTPAVPKLCPNQPAPSLPMLFAPIAVEAMKCKEENCEVGVILEHNSLIVLAVNKTIVCHCGMDDGIYERG